MAIEDFSKVVELEPEHVSVYYYSGLAYLFKGNFDDLAIENFNQAIEQNPDHADAYYYRGTVYNFKGELDISIQDFTKAIELNPDYAEAYHSRGNAYAIKGEFDKAINDYTEVLKLRPKVAEYYYTRGETWLLVKDWKEAKADLTAALLQDVDVAGVFHNTYKSIDAFEQKIEDRLPKEIVQLLTPRSEPFEIDKEARIALGMKYYGDEILSSGLAARLAGVPRVEFIILMGDYGLSPLYVNEEELINSGF